MGLPKTGTTSIQSALFAQRAALLRAGILYPGFAENHTTPLMSIIAEAPHLLPTNVITGVRSRNHGEDLRSLWSGKLAEALATPDWQQVVLSGEGLSAARAQRLTLLRDRLAEHCDTVTALLCLRDPYRWRISQIQQKLKMGATMDDEIDRLSRPGLYARIVQRIEKALGADHVRLLIFEDLSAHPAGLVGGFAAAVGVPDGLIAPRQGRNPSMSHRAAMVLEVLNRDIPIIEGRQKNPRRSLWVDRALRRLPGPSFVLPAPLADQMQDAVAADRSWAQERFGREVWKNDPAGPRREQPQIGDVPVWAAVGRLLGRVLP